MAATVTWIVLALADVRAYCVADQRDILDKWKAMDEPPSEDPNQPASESPFAPIMRDVANEVRTAVAANPANTLSATAYSVPPELKRTAVYLLLDALSPHFSNATGLVPAQVEQVKAAKELLAQVRDWTAKGKQFLISAPADPQTERPQDYRTLAEATQYNDRLATRETLAGL